MSSSVHVDNKKKEILILEKDPTQGLEHTLTAEKTDSINFTVTKKEFCISLHYSGANSYLWFYDDYDAIAVDDLLEIHKYFMKK